MSRQDNHAVQWKSTYQLELAKVLQVNDGDGTGRSLDLSFGKGDELEHPSVYIAASPL